MVVKLLDQPWSVLVHAKNIDLLKVGYIGVVAVPLYAHFVQSANGFGFDIELPWKLVFLYIGSIVLSVAHFLNEFLCPSAISRHGSVSSFRVSIVSELDNLNSILSHSKDAYKKHVKSMLEEKFLGKYSAESLDLLAGKIVDELYQQKINKVAQQFKLHNFDQAWNEDDVSNKEWRVVIVLLYLIAGVIAISLTCVQFATVIRAITLF